MATKNERILNARLTTVELELMEKHYLTDVQAMQRIVEMSTKMLAQRKEKARAAWCD